LHYTYWRRYQKFEASRNAKAKRRTVCVFVFSFVMIILGAIAIPVAFKLIKGRQLCMTSSSNSEENRRLCEEGTKLLEHVDGSTIFFYRLAKTLMPVGARAAPEGVDPLRVSIPTKKEPLPKRPLIYGSELPIWDEDNGDESTGSIIIFTYLRSKLFNPLKDKEVHFDSESEGKRLLGLVIEDDLSPLTLTTWDEMSSNDAMSRFAFSGLVAHHTHRVADLDSDGIVYVNDFSWLAPLAVRPGFERYGATLYFDKDTRLRKIYWSHGDRNVTAVARGEPGWKAWEHAKWAFRCSAIVGVTILDHLITVHYQAANFLTSALFENLDPQHPIRRLLRPHTFGTTTTNMGASHTLSTTRGLVHRATALTEAALFAGLELAWRTSDIDVVNDFTKTGMDEVVERRPWLYPYGQDAAAYHRLVRDHVLRYVSIYFKTDQDVVADEELVEFFEALKVRQGTKFPSLTSRSVLVEQLTTLIVLVTGYHNHVGNIADYFTDPTFLAAKIRPNKEIADVQAAFQGVNIALMTSMKTPKLLNDFTHVLLDDEHSNATRAALATFQDELAKLAKIVDERNAKASMTVMTTSEEVCADAVCEDRERARIWPCNSYNPGKILSSVSV